MALEPSTASVRKPRSSTKLLERAGMTARAIRGFERVVDNHLAAAHHGACGDADACLAPRSAARAFSLDFVPIQRERYDLVIRRSSWELPAVQAFLDVLQRASLRRNSKR
jgi:putative molybdopterin biosynthesis protein